MSAPTDTLELQTFLGMANYLSRYTANLATKTAVLRDLTKKESVFAGFVPVLETWKVMEFDNLDSRPGKSWNFGPGPGKSWNFMFGNVYAAELPTVLDCLTRTREKR